MIEWATGHVVGWWTGNLARDLHKLPVCYGPPGAGKSRLAYDFPALLKKQGPSTIPSTAQLDGA